MQHVVARVSLYIGLGGRIERDLSEFYPHAEVLADGSHQCSAHDVHQPPRQGGGEAGVINPAAQQVEEVNGDCEIQALLSSADEVQQAQSTAKHRQRLSNSAMPVASGTQQELTDEYLTGLKVLKCFKGRLFLISPPPAAARLICLQLFSCMTAGKRVLVQRNRQ